MSHSLQATSQTTTALLDGLHDLGDREAWAEFDRRYRPLLLAFCVKLGLSDADAADIAQDTVARFVVSYREGGYDRRRGRLRSWLIAIAKGRIDDLRRKHARRRIHRGESAIVNLPDDPHLTAIWEEERRRILLEQALHDVRANSRCKEQTLEAFELLCFRQLAPAVVAKRLGMSLADVFRAKSRVASHIRRAVARLERIERERE
jgi:RNA polymerase sigma factor (sigma-70 family)